MAIIRGGMQTPTAASDVFAIDTQGSTGDGKAPTFRSSFPVDMAMRVDTDEANTEIAARLQQGKWLVTATTAAEASANSSVFDFNNGWYSATSTISTYHGLMWARARGYFDVVCYDGSNSNRTFNHSLGVAHEMIWVKKRSDTRRWRVFIPALSGILKLNEDGAMTTNDAKSYFGDNNNIISPTATQFTVTEGVGDVNYSGDTYIAYLFATVANVSKVGSFTQSGATNVACGFTGSTPALIILKRTDDTGDWYLFDSTRGIVAGNDKSKYLNTNAAQITNADVVDPYSGGFATTSSLTNGDYLFYAIASIA